MGSYLRRQITGYMPVTIPVLRASFHYRLRESVLQIGMLANLPPLPVPASPYTPQSARIW